MMPETLSVQAHRVAYRVVMVCHSKNSSSRATKSSAIKSQSYECHKRI